MRSDRELAAIEAMLLHAEEAISFVDGLDAEGLMEDRRTFLAVTRCLEIVSEASRRLSDETRGAHPEVPWSLIKNAGNIYRHYYEGVEVDTVWNTVTVRLPDIVIFARAELARREL